MKRSLLALLAALGLLSDAAPVFAVTHYQQVEVCSAQVTAGCAKFDASGNLLVSAGGGGSITVTNPYGASSGQTTTAASFVGVGGVDANSKFSPLQEDASQNLLVKVNVALPTGTNSIGKVTTVLPYGISAGQTGTANSAVAVAGEDTAGTVTPLLMATSGSPIDQVCGVANTGTTTGPTDTTSCASVATPGDNFGNAVTIRGLVVTSIPEVYSSAGGAYNRVYSADAGNNLAASLKGTMPMSAPYGEYNSSPITLTTGHTAILQTDVNGRLLISGTGAVTFPYTSALTQSPTASSFVGVAGFDGTNVESLRTSTGGLLDMNICDAAGGTSSCAAVPTPTDTMSNSIGLATASENMVWSGAVWQRAKSASAVSASVAGTGLPVDVAMGQYNSSPPTVSSGQYGALQTDVNGRLLVTGSGTTVVTQPTGTQLHAVLDTTSTTAVTQATGTNLHAVLDTTSTTAVTQATGTNLHAVLDTTSTTAVTQATAANLNATVTPAAAPTASATLASVSGSSSSVTLLAAGTALSGWSICNDSSAILYMAKTSSAATSSAYSMAFPAAGTVATCYVETQPGMYGGQINGIWASATGAARVSSW
jgi:hypothetical protein